MTPFIIPEFNARAVALRYYQIVYPERKYTGASAWRQMRQDKKMQKNVLCHVVKEFHDRQQKIIAKYFADVKSA